MLVGASPNQWQAIVEVTASAGKLAALEAQQQLDLRKEGDRFRARQSIVDILSPWFAARDYGEVARLLDAAGACWGPYQTLAELVATDPDCSQDNPLFQRLEQPGIGNYLTPSQPLAFTGLAREDNRPAPLLGQHTDEILAEELGLSSAEIGRLHDEGIVAGSD